MQVCTTHEVVRSRSEEMIRYEIDPETPLVRVRFVAEACPPPAPDNWRVVQRDPAYRPVMPHLIDLRRLRVPPSRAHVTALADAIVRRRHEVPARRAFVVLEDLHFGMLRMLEALTDQEGVNRWRVFRSEEEALAWLMAPEAEDA